MHFFHDGVRNLLSDQVAASAEMAPREDKNFLETGNDARS
jgi:hypothetical protein